MPTVIAHGIGDAADLGLPLGLLVGVAGSAVAGTAAVLSSRAAGGRERPRRDERTLPAALAAPRPTARTVLRAVLGAALLVAFFTAVAGDPDPGENPAPLLLFTVLWGALPLASALAGPVWAAGNPWRLAAAPLLPPQASPAVAERLGLWPAAGGLVLFGWLDVVVRPGSVATALFVVLYGAVVVGGAARWGPAWIGAADPLDAWSRLAGRLSPLGRRPDGRLALRSVRASLATAPAPRGLLLAIAGLVGADLFAAVEEAQGWGVAGTTRVGVQGAVVATALFAVCVGAVWVAGWLATRRRPFLVPALVPVAVGSAVARHLAPLLLDGQALLILLSDPFGLGWDLLGRTGAYVDVEVVPVGAAIAFQLAALIAGHALAVTAAHDRCVARYDLRLARALQLPFRVVVVASAVGFVALRFGT